MHGEAAPGELQEDLRREYERALQEYRDEGGEKWLQQAHKLGRRAMGMGLGILDVVSIHGQAADSLGADRGYDFLSSALAPFEMTHRAFGEANTRLAKLNVTLQAQIAAYDTEHHIAKVLQDAMLETPPRIEGLRIGVAYVSSTEGALVGGDFYDVFHVTDTQVCAVIGDVSGKGVEAASLAAMTKNTIRGYAVPGRSPGDILHLANGSVHRFTPVGLFVTVFLALIDAMTGKVEYASAGHPPALVVSAEGRVRRLDASAATGCILAAFSDANYADASCTLDPGETLVFYTDGAVEARRDGVFLGEQGFCDLLRVDKRDDPTSLLEAAMDDLREYSGGKLRDDVAMLAIRFDREGPC